MFVSTKLIVAPEGLVYRKGFFGGGKETFIEEKDIKSLATGGAGNNGNHHGKIKLQKNIQCFG